MSATRTVAIAPHTPIRREGLRPGPMHAALPGVVPGVWHTACGETLSSSHRGTVVQLTVELALELIGAGRVCRRCDRVGDAIGAGE